MKSPAEEAQLDLLRMLQRINTYAPKIQSNLAREYAFEVAQLASRLMITTRVVPGGHEYGFHWKLTALGLAYLEAHASEIAEEEQVKFLARDADPEAEVLG